MKNTEFSQRRLANKFEQNSSDSVKVMTDLIKRIAAEDSEKHMSEVHYRTDIQGRERDKIAWFFKKQNVVAFSEYRKWGK